MPNWVFNTLTISGEKDELDKIKDKVGAPYVRTMHSFVDGKIEDVMVGFMNPVFAFWNIKRPTDIVEYREKDNWYMWNISHWGTKWDVGISDDDRYRETKLESKTDNELVYKFDTAWSPPLPVVLALSVQHPDTNVLLEYEEETGWGGMIEIKNGKTIRDAMYNKY